MKTVLIALAILSLILPAAPTRAADPVRLRYGVPGLSTLDPVSLPLADRAARDVAENLFVGLTRDPGGIDAPAPVLAEKYTVSPDGLTWTFELRRDVFWVGMRDGQPQQTRPVVAGDFLFALRRACDVAAPNPAARTVYVIRGCRKVATTNPLQVDDIFIARELGVRVVNQFTLEIGVEYPVDLLPMLALPEFRPVPRESVSVAPEGDWAQPDTLLTNGPYLLSARTPTSISLIRNPFWPLERGGNIDQIDVILTTPDALITGVSAGQLDATRYEGATLPAIDPATAQLSAPIPTGRVLMLGWATERNLLNKPEFRQALALATDRAAVLAPLAARYAPQRGFTPPPYAVTGSAYADFSPDAAKAALRAAGFDRCRLPERLEMITDQTPEAAAIANALFAGWAANLNCPPSLFRVRAINAELVERAANGTFSTIRNTDDPRPQLWLFTWGPDYRTLPIWLHDGLHCQFGYLKSLLPCGDADNALVGTVLPNPPDVASTLGAVETAWFGPSGTFPVLPLAAELSYVISAVGVKVGPLESALWFDGWSR